MHLQQLGYTLRCLAANRSIFTPCGHWATVSVVLLAWACYSAGRVCEKGPRWVWAYDNVLTHVCWGNSDLWSLECIGLIHAAGTGVIIHLWMPAPYSARAAIWCKIGLWRSKASPNLFPHFVSHPTVSLRMFLKLIFLSNDFERK